VFILLSSCHEKDYDIIEEAKNLILKDKEKNKIKTKNNNGSKKIITKKIEKKTERIIDNNKDNLKNKNFKKIEKPSDKKNIQKEQKNSRVLKNLKNNDIDEKKIENLKKFKKSYGKAENGFSNTIKVGVMLPLSGVRQDVGNLILNAIEMAIFQTEDNKLELIIKDTEAKPEKAKSVFFELINEGVSIVIGPLFSKSLAAIQSSVQASKVNVFALTNNINLAKQGIWVFGVDPQAQTKKVLEFALEKGSKKIAALLPKNAYGLLLFDTISKFSKENLIEIKEVEFYEFSIENQRKASQKISKGFDQYQEKLNQLKEQEDNSTIDKNKLLIEKPFDSVFIAAAGQNLTILSSQLQYNNVDPKLVQYLGISSWENNSILTEPALEGGVFVTTSQLYQDKIKLIYKNSFNKEMPNIAMIAYDIVALLDSLEYTENIININNLINEEGYIGLRGLFRLKNNGIVERTFQLKQVKNKRFSTFKKAITQFSNF
tara:strand:- start:2941 stop:4401 length:1461 start_codon:yes stop_codon:yes gene_type:complete